MEGIKQALENTDYRAIEDIEAVEDIENIEAVEDIENILDEEAEGILHYIL